MAHQTILVTGGAGHVGSHVIEMLVTDPMNRVISLDNYFIGRHDNEVHGAEYREGHTKDIASLVPETPDIIYHLGEYSRIKPSHNERDRVFDMNLAGTLAVAEFWRERQQAGDKPVKLVYAGSSTKFAVEGDGRIQSPYSFTKAVNADLISGYGKWYSLPFAICYFFNGFGPRELGQGTYATLIAKFQELYLAGEPLPVDGGGGQTRNFTCVKDLARGIILAGERGSGNGYTLSASKAYSINQIAVAFGAPTIATTDDPGRAGVNPQPEFDQKVRSELGWEPTVDVMDYIQEFIQSNPRR